MRQAPRGRRESLTDASPSHIVRMSGSRITMVGSPPEGARERLRGALRHARARFEFYQAVFANTGISGDDVERGDPFDVLRALPCLDVEGLHRLAEESLRVGEHIVDLETSSGTTGPAKRRFISYDDDESDHQFLAELFGVCGIGAADKVACLDVDPVVLTTSFARALDMIPVKQAYCLAVGADPDRTVATLRRMDPTVILTIPSLADRCLESLGRAYAGRPSHALEKMVLFSEPVAPHTRSALESSLGVQVFSYYGAAETSSLGIECRAHDGIHLFTDRNVIEVDGDDPQRRTGRIVVTTLARTTLLLLRYALSDEISVKPGPCACGLEYPRVDVVGRSDDSFSVLGVKAHFAALEDAVYEGTPGPVQMQLVLTRQRWDVLTMVLPEHMRDREPRILDSLMVKQRDLGFLVRSGHLRLEFRYVDEGYFLASRKLKRVDDRRSDLGRNIS